MLIVTTSLLDFRRLWVGVFEIAAGIIFCVCLQLFQNWLKNGGFYDSQNLAIKEVVKDHPEILSGQSKPNIIILTIRVYLCCQDYCHDTLHDIILANSSRFDFWD